MEFKDAVSARRSEYMLDAADVDVDAVVSALRSIAGKVPSSFNAQSARMFVLSGEDHERFWGIVEDILAERSKDAERFKATRAKLATFRAAAGTILFYEIDAKTEALMEEHPSYRDLFPQWAEHGNAMLQFAHGSPSVTWVSGPTYSTTTRSSIPGWRTSSGSHQDTG